MRHITKSTRTLCVGLALSAGCAMDPAGDDSLAETTQELYAEYEVPLWPLYTSIPLCFAYGHGATALPVSQRAAVTAFIKERINLTWGSVLPFGFTWRDCPTSGESRDVMLNLFSDRSGGECNMGQDALSTWQQRAELGDAAPGCNIGISPDWNANQGRLLRNHQVLIHEFGHVLGFSHEFERPDAVGSCAEPDPSPGGHLLGDYDPMSIMRATYCEDPDQFWLSPGDVTGARSLYGTRYPATAAKDIVWQDASGFASIFRMSGTIMVREDFIPDTAGSPFKIIGTGDFDGDGIGDLLWRRPSNGGVLVWLLDAAGTRRDTFYTALPTEYTFQGIARFNADNRSDVLWRSSQSGKLLTWMMNGADIGYTREVTAPDQSWQVKLVGDFNKDGRGDLFWRHPNSATAIWLMNDGAVLSTNGSPGTADASWTAKAVGDFNGDGRSDVFWQRTNGATSIWLMNGNAIGSYGSPRSVTAGWQVQVAADVDADGKSDLLWRKNDGSTGLWVMDGLTIRLDVPLPFAPVSWNMVGAASGTVSPVN